jgi:hypothetical protein
MATPDNSASPSRSRSRTWRILSAVAGSGLVLGLVIFFGVGRWLVVEDASGALDVVREVLGLLNAWARLPLHAAR